MKWSIHMTGQYSTYKFCNCYVCIRQHCCSRRCVDHLFATTQLVIVVLSFFYACIMCQHIFVPLLLRAWRGRHRAPGQAGPDARAGHGVGPGLAERSGGCGCRRALPARGFCQSRDPGVKKREKYFQKIFTVHGSVPEIPGNSFHIFYLVPGKLEKFIRSVILGL